MFLLKELIRLSSQHRTLYCYSILSVWIFLLIAGKYFEVYTKTLTHFPIRSAV